MAPCQAWPSTVCEVCRRQAHCHTLSQSSGTCLAGWVRCRCCHREMVDCKRAHACPHHHLQQGSSHTRQDVLADSTQPTSRRSETPVRSAECQIRCQRLCVRRARKQARSTEHHAHRRSKTKDIQFATRLRGLTGPREARRNSRKDASLNIGRCPGAWPSHQSEDAESHGTSRLSSWRCVSCWPMMVRLLRVQIGQRVAPL